MIDEYACFRVIEQCQQAEIQFQQAWLIAREQLVRKHDKTSVSDHEPDQNVVDKMVAAESNSVKKESTNNPDDDGFD